MTFDRVGSPARTPGPEQRRFTQGPKDRMNLGDPDLYVSDAADEVFRAMRNSSAVQWSFTSGDDGFWAVTRFEEAEAVLQDPETFSADYRRGGMRLFDVADVTSHPRPDFLSIDPPDHGAFRRALQPAFAPKLVAELTVNIRRRARDLVEAISSRGRAEFVSEVAQPFTIGLLIDLLQVRESDAAQLIIWSNTLVGEDDPELWLSTEHRVRVVRDMDNYVGNLLRERNGGGGRDLVSLLGAVRFDGEALDFEAMCVNFALLVTAVNETTRHAISGSLVALSAFPEERAKLLTDLSLIPTAVKELIRWVTPLRHVRRTATRATVLGGTTIRKGDKVVVFYSSVNRDEAAWAGASELRLDRYRYGNAAPHMAFGSGAHFCLGWRYAELQMTVLLEELLQQLPDIMCEGEPSRLRSNFIAGIKALPVTFTPRIPTPRISHHPD